MRIAIGAYQVTSNSFATQTTTLQDIRANEMPQAALLSAPTGSGALHGFLKRAKEHGWEIVPLGFYFPPLGGKLTDEAHEWMKQQMLSALRDAWPVDGVFLQLHGTAVSKSLEDLEGDLLDALRGAVGDVPIHASLDGHANVSARMAAAADFLIGVKTNPHSDFYAIGYRSAELMQATLEGSVKPVMARAQPAMAPALQKLYIAPGWPMEHLMRLAHNRRRRDPRILDISLLLGFYLSDRKETGISVLVTTDADPQLAAAVAQEISDACWARRHAFHTDMVSVEEGVAEAMAADDGLVIMGDLSDSGGAGTPGDGTALLAAFLQQDARGVVIGSIVDPQAVRSAFSAGVGAQVSLEVGGKIDRFHGEPVRISGKVRSLHDGSFRTGTVFMNRTVHRGPVAVIDCGGIEVILTSRHTIIFEPNHFRSLGIEPTERKILVCKSEMQHRAGLAGIGHRFIDVDTPGLATQDLSRLPFSRIRRPVFPLDDL